MTNNSFLKPIAVLVFCFLFGVANGQPGPPPANPVPISGIEILLGVGALLGAKNLWDTRKRKNIKTLQGF